MRVLFIKNSQRLEATVGAALRHSGYVVDIAGYGEEAVGERNRTNTTSFALDIILRNLDGLAVLQRLRKQGNLLLLTENPTGAGEP